MKLLDLLKEIKAKPGTSFKVDPDKVLQMFLDEMIFWSRNNKNKEFKLIGYKEYTREDRDDLNYLLYFFLIEGTEEVVKVILNEIPGTDIYEYNAEDFMDLDDFKKRTDIYKYINLNEIKIKPATQPKVDPDKVLEYYIEDLKDHLRMRTDGSKRMRLDKRPQLLNPKNYKLINYTEHFDNHYFGGNEEHIVYHFKYKFTGEIAIAILTKGRPGQADDNMQISDDYWYLYGTDLDGFNKMTRYERVDEIKVKSATQPKINAYEVLEYYIKDLKAKFKWWKDEWKGWKKSPKLLNPKNYELVNYTEHFNNARIGAELPYKYSMRDYIAYHFKYKPTGKIMIVFLIKKGKPYLDNRYKISDDYYYFYFDDEDNVRTFSKIDDLDEFNRRINEIKVKPSQPSLLKLIEDNLDFIKRKFDISIIHSIELVSDNPQEVEIVANVIIDEFDDEYDLGVGILFRFLEDAENDEDFVSDFGQDPGLEYMIITLDGFKIAVIELEIND